MSVVSALAVYFIIWWVVFFAVLPWGMRTQAEEGEIEPGSVSSAPARPRMWRKALFTSIVAAIVQGALWAAIEAGVTIDDLPLPNPVARTLER